MDTIVVCSQDQMGHGDQPLGRKTLVTILKNALTLPRISPHVFDNAGVSLPDQRGRATLRITL